jgi:hypothetical protein
MRDASKVGRLPGGVVSQRLCREVIELAMAHVSLELPIPHRRIEIGEPPSERSELVGGEPLYGLLDRFDLSHTAIVAALRVRGEQ